MCLLHLYNNDCLEGMRKYPDGYFDLAIVDPPYGIGESRGANNSRGTTRGAATQFESKDWDNDAPMAEYFTELFRVSKNQVIFGANHFISRFARDSSCWIVWDKKNGNSDFADCELAWTSFHRAVRMARYTWDGFRQGGSCQVVEKRIHPTQKPISLYYWILEKFAAPECKVLDTHLGSGSSAIAAHQFGIHEFVGFEIDASYFRAANLRIQQQTRQASLFRPSK